MKLVCCAGTYAFHSNSDGSLVVILVAIFKNPDIPKCVEKLIGETKVFRIYIVFLYIYRQFH